MRGMQKKLMTWALVILGLAMLSTTSQAFVLVNLTNQVWKYNQTEAFTDTGWTQPAFNDSAWPSGRSVLAREDAAAVRPFTNTVLDLGRITYYFRTTFTIPTGVDPSSLILTSSNFLDDGAVFHLNGQEAMRWNILSDAPNPVTYDTVARAANPPGDGVRFVLVLTNVAQFLVPGVNTLAVEVHQNAVGSSDIVWGTDLHAVVAFAPTITQQPSPTNVLQGRSATLTVVANAAPAPTYQWFRTDTGTPIAGATAASYTIQNMDETQAGQYHVHVENPYGSVDSTPVQVTYTADTFPPKVLSVTADPLNPLTVTVNLDESILSSVGSTPDPFNLSVDALTGPPVGISATAWNTTSNAFILTLDNPLDPLGKYTVSYFGDGAPPELQDYFGNGLANFTTNVTFPAVFRQDANGYTGTLDTELRENTPDASGADLAIINVDQQDPNNVHALLRFENIIGGSPGQVPFGAEVTSATLRIWTDDPGSSPMRVMRMLVPWDESSTWNSMGAGLDQTNGVECTALLDFSVSTDDQFDDLDVTALVQEWVNGAPNYGFGFIPIGTDGWRWATSENGTLDHRPTLRINYKAVEKPCNIVTQPASVTVNEGQPFTLTVVSQGTDLTYQWFRNNVAISGATGFSYTANAVPSSCTGGNAGTYRVEIHGAQGSVCISQNATVTVTPDTTAPALVSAVGQPDQTKIVLTFNSTDLNPTIANDTSHYSVTPGITVTGASYSNGVVTLTTTARAVGTSYGITVSGIRDNSCAGNLMATTTIATIEQQIRLVPFNATWKYNNSGCDQGTAWSGPAYDDSLWPSAQAVLGWETTAGTFTALFNLGLNTNNMTLLSRTNTTGCGMNGTNITDYFRTTFNVPFDPSGATVQIRHVTDDGAVVFLNGAEAGRYNMTNAAINYLTTALSAPGEGVIRTLTLDGSALHTGANTLAVEVHQDSFASSDVDWAGELLITIGNVRPKLTIVDNGNGTITISWNPNAGTLQQRDALGAGAWTDTPGTGNPRTITKSGSTRFYSLRQ
jgi:hypothetical protein